MRFGFTNLTVIPYKFISWLILLFTPFNNRCWSGSKSICCFCNAIINFYNVSIFVSLNYFFKSFLIFLSESFAIHKVISNSAPFEVIRSVVVFIFVFMIYYVSFFITFHKMLGY